MKLAYCALKGESGHDAGRRLLEQLYREATEEDLPPIRTARLGKPYFEDSPWHFSIAHTKGHAFCVLAKENIAIDAEELDRKVRPAFPDWVLSPMEKAQYDAAENKQKAILTFWVLKEAAAKLTGEGMQGGFRHTQFQLDDPRVREIDGCLVAIMTE